MRIRALPLVAALTLCIAPSLTGQWRYGVATGVTWSSPLVRDSIVEAITVGPAPAFTLSFEIDAALDSLYRVGVRLAWSRSVMQRRAPSGTADIVDLTIWRPAIRLLRPFGPLTAEVNAGLTVYRAARATGIFRDGGAVTPAVGAAARLRGPALMSIGLDLGATWTVARFSTPTLRLSGFTGEQGVHRVELNLSLSRRPRAP